jgi:hypothetical protein
MSNDDINSVKGIGWPCGQTQQPYRSAYSIVEIVITSIVMAHLMLEYKLVVQHKDVTSGTFWGLLLVTVTGSQTGHIKNQSAMAALCTTLTYWTHKNYINSLRR